MKQFIVKNRRNIAGAAVCLVLGILTLSFQDTPYVNAILNNQSPEDTTPVKKKKGSMTMKEFDKLSTDLDKEVLSSIGDINLENIEKEVRESLKKVDVEKIMKEVEASLKEINVEKIMHQALAELKNVDMVAINDETREALANAKKEMEKASEEMKKIDKEAIKTELEKAKAAVEKSKAEFRKIDMKKLMEEAREGINKAKAALKELKQMFTEMEQDGLISSKQGFTIEYKNKDLYINGNKQTEQVTDRYRRYFKDDHFEITIDKE